MNKETLHFKVNVGLKDVVGRELINDDNIAIIELIKNSKDARSDRVDVSFLNAAAPSTKSRLIVQDYGVGMSLNDIKEKWLNIAYSEKRDVKKSQKNPSAGSKGIGRFSCDRLGKKLDLYTRQKNGSLIHLSVKWPDFEFQDQSAEISSVDLEAEEVSDTDFSKATGLKAFKVGTVLYISELRSVWGREKVASLRHDLERFIMDPDSQFQVWLRTEDFPNLSGRIENKIFEKLSFRTTSIHSVINAAGDEIKTTLKHDGHNIFTLTEKNSYPHLKNIKASIYYLNQPAKAFFKRETGYRLVDFGSVFLFLNGFRVLPYGNEGDDWLGLDKRKQQGQRRYLGTREIVGTVEILDGEASFRPVSSREGVAKNEAYMELTSSEDDATSQTSDEKQYGFLQRIIRKLEKFVVDGLDWDQVFEEFSEKPDDFFLKNKNVLINRNAGILSNIEAVIKIRSPEKNILDIDLNAKHLIDLAKGESASYKDMVSSLEQKLSGKSLSKMTPAEKRDISKFISRQAKELRAKTETNKKLGQKTKELLKDKGKLERTAEQLTSENLFLRQTSNSDLDTIINLHHQTIVYADTIAKNIENFRRKILSGLDVSKVVEFLDKIELQNDKILQISKFATHANFRISSAKISGDLLAFIKSYLGNIIQNKFFSNIEIFDEIPSGLKLAKTYRPLELTMAIDNLINNAIKAGAKKITFSARSGRSAIVLSITDNGSGLNKSIADPQSIFDKGVTTTSGSGLGLYHVKKVFAEDLSGEIQLASSEKGNFSLEVRLS